MYAMMKATDHCNLRCRYCYVPEPQRQVKEHLAVEQMPTLFRKMFDWQQNEESAGHLEVCWSGGEMLSLPLPWWEDMLRMQQKVYQSGRYTFRLSNSIQTNFTLMDEERLNLLTRNNVNIGMSLDGPKECMDKTRVFPGGASAFDIIVEKLLHFREKQGFKPGVILVLSRANVGLIDEVWEFFNDLRMGFQVNTYHFAPSSAPRHEDNAITVREYLDAMCHLFDLWSERTDSIDIGASTWCAGLATSSPATSSPGRISNASTAMAICSRMIGAPFGITGPEDCSWTGTKRFWPMRNRERDAAGAVTGRDVMRDVSIAP
jgi:sulfatase maturation enzyme AslB (radical SAM superfamily)